jgi:hypothetical protein
MIEIQIWHLITLLISFFGCVAGFWKFTESRAEKVRESRERNEDKRWEELHRHLDARFKDFSEAAKENAKESARLERAFMELRAELPNNYVRREEWLRGQSTIEAKIDGLAHRLENLFLKQRGTP